MTGPASNLPEEIRKRIEDKKREAYDAEIRNLEGMIGTGLESRIAERRSRLDELTQNRRREADEASMKQSAELQSFGEEILRALDEENLRRRTDRLKDENARRETRLQKEKEREDRRRAAQEEAKKRAAQAGDPAHKVVALAKKAQAHFDREEMEQAAAAIAEGLEIDGFNADLIELDGRVRAAMADDTFTSKAEASPGEKKGKEKGKEKDKGKAKAEKPKKQKPLAEQSPRQAPKPGRRFPAWAFTGIAALLIAVAGIIAWLEYRPKVVERGMTLAVLPWNASGDEGLAVFASALPEVLVRTLSTGQTSVGILGYSTTAGLAAIGPDPVASLSRLGYSHFLRGVISRRDTAFVVHLELSDSVGGTLWSADYDRDSTGLFLVPFEAAYGLKTHFREAPPAGTAMEVKKPGAFLLYLRGLNALRMTGGSGVDQAIADFSGAVAADSSFSEAWAGLANALVAKRSTTEPGTADPIGDAHAAARRSIDLAPGAAAGRFAMTRVLIEQHNFVGALSALDSAASISPSDSRIPYLRGMAFFRSGQVPQSIDILQHAYTLDPRNPAVLGLLATVQQVNRSFDRALWFRETAMHFTGDSLRYLAGPFADLIMHEPALALANAQRVTSACLRLLEGDPYEYVTLYSLARILQGSGDITESLTYFNGLESSLRAYLKTAPGDTKARMFLGLTLTRTGKYADAISLGEAAVAADSNNIEAKYLLARIYALQMYSTQTKSVDPAKQTRATDLLRQAIGRRFIDDQLCSADLYNLYSHGDIRSLIQ